MKDDQAITDLFASAEAVAKMPLAEAQTWMHNWVNTTWTLSNKNHIRRTHRDIDLKTSSKAIVAYATDAAMKGFHMQKGTFTK